MGLIRCYESNLKWYRPLERSVLNCCPWTISPDVSNAMKKKYFLNENLTMHSCPPVLSNKPPLTSFGQELAKSMTSHLLSDSLINGGSGFKSTPNTSYCLANDDATHSRNLSCVPFRWVFVECCFGLPTIHVPHHPLRVPCGHMLVE